MIHLSPATPGTLRERFIEDVTVRGFTDKTRHDNLRTVAGFAAFLERSPSSATAEDRAGYEGGVPGRLSLSGVRVQAVASAVAVSR